tara:strand:+ start:3824 stop:4228 length:405 start_codon:yes stop_codon:yes gene_type:complete
MNLNKHALINKPVHEIFVLNERLPSFINDKVEIKCTYSVKQLTDFYELSLITASVLPIICQRCLEVFSYDYHNQTQLAICQNIQKAQDLMAEYEVILSETGHINLPDILIDELYLWAPDKHLNLNECQTHKSTV